MGDTHAYAAPVTATQTLICRIWADVLGVERVGIDDDFFALGGHSLVAVRGAARLGDALGRTVEIALVFACPKVADLAAQLDGAVSADGTKNILDGLQDLLDSL